MPDKESTIKKIELFVQTLETHQVVKSTSPLYELIRNLKRTRFEKGLSYTLQRLEFINISHKQLIRNDKWDPTGLSVHLNLDITLNCNGYFRFGCVKESVVEIIYEAYSEETAELARGAWHLDFHQQFDGEGDPDFIHPSYHFHHGGRTLKDNIVNYGDLLIMDAPRLMHPPLDLFLAVDFLLTNFIESRTWKNLRADTTYQAIVKDSQKDWWKDYFKQISEYWDNYGLSGINSTQACGLARLSNPHLF